MKHVCILCLLISSILVSCSSSEYDLIQDSMYEGVVSKNTKISEQEAAENAIALLQQLTPGTRSGSEIVVKSIKAVRSKTVSTRSSSSPDTLLYIINFADDKGFAIMPADNRALPVYALSIKGGFSDCEICNPSHQIVLDAISNDVIKRINIGPGLSRDTTKVLPGYKAEVKKIKYGPYICDYQRKTLRPCIELSKYCFDQEGNQGHTGCSAIALEHLMSYYKWPLEYKGYSFDWDKINNGNDYDAICRILSLLGLPENLDMTYDGPNKIGGAYRGNYIRTLRNFNYIAQTNCDIKFFSKLSIARENLKTGPILMDAQSNTNKSRHAWVIDGYISLSYLNHHTDEYDLQYELFHCTWGDAGKCDGYYYVADTFQFTGKPDMLDDVDSGDYSNVNNIMHETDFIFWSNVVPNSNP